MVRLSLTVSRSYLSGESSRVEVVPPGANHRSSFAAQRFQLGERKLAEGSSRAEVVAAFGRTSRSGRGVAGQEPRRQRQR